MKTMTKTLLCAVLLSACMVGNAAASLTTFPFADFQGKVYVDTDPLVYNNTVKITSWTDSSTNEGSDSDPIIGQSVSGGVFSGFVFDTGTYELTIAPGASFDFQIGSYLSAQVKDFDIDYQGFVLGQYSYLINAYLYDQKFNNDPPSQFIAEYMAASPSTNPQGQLLTWEYLIDLTGAGKDWDYIVNVSGKVMPAVPLPGAVWLLAGGLSGLGLLKRRKKC